MMKTAIWIFSAGLAAMAGTASGYMPSLPAPEEVLSTLRRVNDRFLLNWPEPGRDIVTDRARPSNIWTRATYFEGLMALHAIDRDARYYDYAVRWGQSHNWQPAYGSADPRHADNQCCGQTYLDLHLLEPQPERLAGIKAAIDLMVNSTKADDWWWIDALQMAMPVFTRLGGQTGDTRYFQKMYALYAHTKYTQGGGGLYNPVEHLWWRDADFDPPYLEPNGANCYWSRGNGWVFAGLARVLDLLPVDDPHRAEYLRDFQDMAAALAPLQRLDGFWNVSLRDPENYGGRELTGTAFFTYGMAWGVRKGHLPRQAYLPVVTRGWRALAGLAVRPDGTLGYVQGSGKQPSDGQPVTYDSAPNFDDFGTGAFLLAGCEVHRLASTPVIDRIAIWKTWPGGESQPGDPFIEFEVILEGTSVAGAFPSGSAHVILPDGRTTIALQNASRAFADRGAPSAIDAKYPNGLYTIVWGGRTIVGVRLGRGPASYPAEYPPPRRVAVEAGNLARPILLDAGPLGAPDAGMRVQLQLQGAEKFRYAFEAAGATQPRAVFTLPAYSLAAASTVEMSVTYEKRTFDLAAVDLGASGSPAIVAGIRSVLSGDQFDVTEPTHSKERLLNLSSRGVASGDNPLIAGFVVSPGGPKMVLVRAVGPGLQAFGVPDVLSNPNLRVYNANSTRAWQNDDWQSSAQYLALTTSGAAALQAGYANVRDPLTAAIESGAFPLMARNRDAALVLVLPPGNYTAHVTPSGSTAPGAALLEVYELATTQTNPRLTNLSTRGTVSPAQALTTGFVVAGGSRRVLLRGIGPALDLAGLPAAATLRDPTIAVFDATGSQVAANDNWEQTPDKTAQVAFRSAVGAFPLPSGSRDAELALTLPPGAYTLRVVSADGSSGIALAEVYTLPPGS